MKKIILLLLITPLFAPSSIISNSFNNYSVIAEQESTTDIETYRSQKLDWLQSTYSVIDETAYEKEEYEKITDCYQESLIKIISASTIEEIDQICQEFTDFVKNVPTILSSYKEVAKEKLEQTLEALSLYRKEQQEEFTNVVNEGCKSIDAATSTTQVDLLVAETIVKLNEIKTDAQLTEEELIAAKEVASKSVDEYYLSLKLSNYSNSNQLLILSYCNKAKSEIEKVKKIDDLQSILDELDMNVKGVPTKGGCSGSLAVTIIVILVLVGAISALVICRYKKTERKS